MKVAGKFDDARPASRQDRRRAALRLLTTLAGMTALSLAVCFFDIPEPSIVLMTGLIFFTAAYGFGAGLVSSAVTVGCSMFLYSENHDWIAFGTSDLQRLAVIALCAIAGALLIGDLKRRQADAARRTADVDRAARGHSQDAAALTDALTGVRNRFGLRRDYGRFENRYVHVMMLDLDNFKRVNDTYGHAVGDYILKKAGQQLTECFGADRCYRYGGDEFLILCVDMDENAFLDRLNALKQGLNAVHLNDKHLRVSFSAGYVYGDCEFSYDLRLMMHQADDGLYRAKREGKNRVVGAPFSRSLAEDIEHDANRRERRAMNVDDLFA